MVRHALRQRAGWALLCGGFVACGRDSGPRTPLSARANGAQDAVAIAGASTAHDAAGMGPSISGPAKAALDSGNVLFRAKDYASALTQYRLSAALAPDEAAPALGMFMVADATHNPALADSAVREMRRRGGDPGTASDPDSTFRLNHGGIKKASGG